MGVTMERLRGEVNIYKNANSHYRKIIMELNARVNELELKLNERGLNDDK